MFTYALRSPTARIALAGGGGQVLLALALAASARLYGAYAIGLFAGLLALGQFGAILVTGRIEQVLPRVTQSARWSITKVLCGASVVIAVPIGLLCGVAGHGQIDVSILLSSVALVFATSVYGIANMSLLAQRMFNRVAVTRTVNAIITAVSQVVGGLLWPSPETLLFTYSLGSIAGALVAAPCLRDFFRSRGRDGAWKVFKQERLFHFGLTVGFSALLSAGTLALPILALNVLYGESVAASFFLARRLLVVPVQLISRTLNEVSYANLARKSIEEVASYVSRWVSRLWIGGLAILVFGSVSGPLVSFVVGPDFVDLWIVMVFQSLPAAGQLVGASLGNVLLAVHAEGVRLFWNSVRLGSLALALWGVWMADVGYVFAVGIVCVVSFVGLLALMFATLHEVGRQQRRAFLAEGSVG